jgi:ubiquinone/menaquinone biosynthesis C-methylase UbiE
MSYGHTLFTLSLVVVLAGCQQTSPERDRPTSPTSHGDFNAHIARMEDPARAEWQRPLEVIAALELVRSERVADIGAGTGYFTLPIARALGAQGTVYAVDVDQRMIDYLKDRLAHAGQQRVTVIKCTPDDPLLEPASVDTILFVNTWHHIPDHRAYLKKLDRALAPGGRIVIIDFLPKPREERGFGPPLEMQLPREVVDQEMAQAGFTPTRVHDFLEEQYFVEYRRETTGRTAP